MSKPESLTPHRIDTCDFKSMTWKTTITDAYEGGLDPYGEIPFKALRVSNDILEIDKQLKECIEPCCGRYISNNRKTECFNVGVMFNIEDFEKRYRATRLDAEFEQPREKGFQLIQIVYYLYPNGIGVFKKIDFTSMGAIEESRVLDQHFVTIADLPSIRHLKDYLLNRD